MPNQRLPRRVAYKLTKLLPRREAKNINFDWLAFLFYITFTFTWLKTWSSLAAVLCTGATVCNMSLVRSILCSREAEEWICQHLLLVNCVYRFCQPLFETPIWPLTSPRVKLMFSGIIWLKSSEVNRSNRQASFLVRTGVNLESGRGDNLNMRISSPPPTTSFHPPPPPPFRGIQQRSQMSPVARLRWLTWR